MTKRLGAFFSFFVVFLVFGALYAAQAGVAERDYPPSSPGFRLRKHPSHKPPTRPPTSLKKGRLTPEDDDEDLLQPPEFEKVYPISESDKDDVPAEVVQKHKKKKPSGKKVKKNSNDVHAEMKQKVSANSKSLKKRAKDVRAEMEQEAKAHRLSMKESLDAYFEEFELEEELHNFFSGEADLIEQLEDFDGLVPGRKSEASDHEEDQSMTLSFQTDPSPSDHPVPDDHHRDPQPDEDWDDHNDWDWDWQPGDDDDVP